MTVDGFCDHTAIVPDEEIHQHYIDLLGQGDAILYGRKTYQLMEFWRTFLEDPSEEKSMNDFAHAIDRIPKLVFSTTLNDVQWKSATLVKGDLREEVLKLKDQSGRAVFVGSRSLILQLTKLQLIDEYQLCIHPVIAGKGLPLFENVNDRIIFELLKTKTHSGGAVTHYYIPTKER